MEITKLRLSNSLSPKDERSNDDEDAYGFSREFTVQPARRRTATAAKIGRECEEAEEDERGGHETVRNPTKDVFEERERMEDGRRERNWRCFEVLSFRRRVLSARAGAC